MSFGVPHCPHPECPFLDLALSSSSRSLTPLTPLACAQSSTSSQIHKAGLFLPALGPLHVQPPSGRLSPSLCFAELISTHALRADHRALPQMPLLTS